MSEVEGVRGKGRLRRKWRDCVKEVLGYVGLIPYSGEWEACTQ